MARVAAVEMEEPRSPDAHGHKVAVNEEKGKVYENVHRHILRDLTDEEIKEYELKVTNVMVDHPLKVMCGCFTLFVILTVISFAVIGFSLDEDDFEDKFDHRTKRMEAVNDLRSQQIPEQPEGAVSRQQSGAPDQLLRSQSLASFNLVYDGKDDNVLTLERLRFIKETEDRIYGHEHYSKYCLLAWYSADDDCPGEGCFWYRSSWDFTLKRSLPDGAKGICDFPVRSLPYLLWHFKIVDPVTRRPCTQDQFDYCVANGDFSYLLTTNDGRTPEEKRVIIEAGGEEPTQFEIDLFVRASIRLSKNPNYSFLSFFYDKTFADPTLPDSNPQKWEAKLIRTNIPFGGPFETVDPKLVSPLCHERLTQSECVAAIDNACEWVPYAGLDKGYVYNVTGCAARQMGSVSSVWQASENDDMQDDWGARFGKAITDDLDELDGPVDVLYIADGTLFDKFMDVIARDSFLAIIGFSFVYLYIQVHTGSFLLASLGMLQVLMPFTIGYFIYKVIFQVKGFYGLSTLTLFIVLAIGADDIFVFMDAWVHANEIPRNDTCTYLKGRFAHAWKRSGKAMGITSVTTMCAFLATMTTPLFEVRYFGLFAAILVFLDYSLVMTFFACSILVYHKFSEYTLGCCCCGGQACGAWFNCCTCYTKEVEEPGDDGHLNCMETALIRPRTFDTLEEARATLGPKLDFSHEENGKPHQMQQNEEAFQDKSYKNRTRVGYVALAVSVLLYIIGFAALSVSRSTNMATYMWLIILVCIGLLFFCAAMNAFRSARDRLSHLGVNSANQKTAFHTYVAPFLAGTSGPGTNKLIRVIPMTVLIILWCVMVWQATTLGKTTKAEQWLPDWHPIQRFIDAATEDFPTSNLAFVHSVSVTIGLDASDPVDRSNWDRWSSSSSGTARLYQSTTKAQDYSSEEFQLFVLTLCSQVLNMSAAGRSLQRANPLILPATLDQNCFMSGFRDYVVERNQSFPVPSSSFVSKLWEYSEYQREMAETEAMRPSDIHFDKLLFKFDNPDKPPVGLDAAVLVFNTTLQEYGNSNSEIRAFFDSWEEFEQQELESDDNRASWVRTIYPLFYPLKGQVLFASEAFVWMHTQDVLVEGAIFGTALSLGLAFTVVLMGTMNVVMAFLVLLELIGVVGYVLGTVALMGWEMGTVETVSIILLVGLSVDYVVHFAIHYTECDVGEDDSNELSERQKRVYETGLDMGPTVLGAAATSFGATVVLLLTWIQFFYKYGICFMFTIVYSFFWAVFFFLPLLSLVGPQSEFGSFRPLLAKCFPKVFAE